MGNLIIKSKARRKIHRTLKRHIPKGVHKAKKLTSFAVEKVLLFIAIIVLSYYLFQHTGFEKILSQKSELGYLGFLIAGIFSTFGFSAPVSIGFFIATPISNIFLAAIIGGLGATIGDIIVFRTIKLSFKKELKTLHREKVIRKIEKIVEKNKHVVLFHYVLYLFAGILIALPISDEIGVSLLAGLTTIRTRTLALIGFITQSIGVFLILYFRVFV